MKRRVKNFLTLLALLLSLALLALWFRSYKLTDAAWYANERHTFGVNSESGRVLFVRGKGPFHPLGFDAYSGRHQAPLWHGIKHLVVFRAFHSGNDSVAVQVPHWFLAALGAVPTFLWFRRRRRDKIAAGLCPRCGYDLRASPGRCPECGAPPTTLA